MDIRVSGHQVNTGSALQDHATDRLNTIVEKHFSRALSSTVTFGKAPAGAFACDIVLHVNHGLILKSHGQAQDAHVSFDQAAEKIEKQLVATSAGSRTGTRLPPMQRRRRMPPTPFSRHVRSNPKKRTSRQPMRRQLSPKRGWIFPR